MPTTASPGNIWYPDNTAPISPIENLFSQMATSVNVMGSTILQSTPSLVPNQAARDALFPTPVQGNSVFRADMGWTETYYAIYDATANPGGVRGIAAGWYPVAGQTPVYSARSDTDTFPATAISTGGTAMGLPSSPSLSRGFTVSPSSGTLAVITPGIYTISAGLRLPSANFFMAIRINGTVVQNQSSQGNGGPQYSNLAVNAIRLGAGDQITAFAVAATSAQVSDTIYRHMSAAFIAPA